MTETTKPVEPIVLELELPHTPEKVWRALTNPEVLATWLMPIDDASKTSGTLRFLRDPEEGGAIDCTVLEAEPHRLIRYRWRESSGGDASEASEPVEIESIVTFELSPGETGGTHLRLVHAPSPAVPIADADSGTHSSAQDEIVPFVRKRPATRAISIRKPRIECMAVTSLRKAA